MTKIELTERLKESIHSRIALEEDFDIHNELEQVLNEIGLSAKDAGGGISFYGADPIVNSTVRLGAGSAVGLMAKSVAAANIYKMRGGKGQNLHVDLAKAVERLGVSYKMLERINGYPFDMTDLNLYSLISFYKTKDNRFIIPSNIYPKLRDKMQKLLGCGNDPKSVAEAISQWNAEDLEKAGEKNGIVMGMVRTLEEFMKEPVYKDYLENTPLIEIEKIGDCDPEPFTQDPSTPLEGVRALGLGHVIAGAGIGRVFAAHGADVLNIWRLNEFEHDGAYYTANVGMRSARLNYKASEGQKRLKELLKESDILFANRRPRLMEEIGMTAEECAEMRPGIIYCNTSAHGDKGPWKNRPGFDQVAGAVTGMMTFEGDEKSPKIPVINVVNDYLVSWLAAAGCMAALARRAAEGGSYRVHVSLTRVSLWLLSLGIFDKDYVAATAGKVKGYEEMKPELFQAQTSVGLYQGYTDQVHMSETPESYRTVLMPRGSNQAVWLPRDPQFKMNFKL
ncbi:CoA transferase [Scopulibacillus cellulosilyticus]|uniref:CoA transferase n=1 Tax=Scopulibacillus cellulosilyticus TaxID=2665665 RepID=A0ABW2PW71_9BACL